MTLSELKHHIDHAYDMSIRLQRRNPDDLIVGIQVKRVGSVGATPTVDVEFVQLGFDWNKNKFLIIPKETLRESDRNEIESIQKQYDELGWDEYTLRNLKEENKKLRKQLEDVQNELNSMIDDAAGDSL